MSIRRNNQSLIYFMQVNLEFNTTQAKPGTQVGLRATAEAGSKVHLLAVDKSVLLLGTGNDISEEKVSGPWADPKRGQGVQTPPTKITKI